MPYPDEEDDVQLSQSDIIEPQTHSPPKEFYENGYYLQWKQALLLEEEDNLDYFGAKRLSKSLNTEVKSTKELPTSDPELHSL